MLAFQKPLFDNHRFIMFINIKVSWAKFLIVYKWQETEVKSYVFFVDLLNVIYFLLFHG